MSFPRPYRRVGFVARYEDAPPSWGTLDVFFCASEPPTARAYHAIVACACEPGHTRIGGSVGIVYGATDEQLRSALAEVPDPVVLIAVHPGAYTDGSAILAELAAAGREGLIVRFDGEVVETDNRHPPGQRARLRGVGSLP